MCIISNIINRNIKLAYPVASIFHVQYGVHCDRVHVPIGMFDVLVVVHALTNPTPV